MRFLLDVGLHDSKNPDGISRYTKELINQAHTLVNDEVLLIKRIGHQYLIEDTFGSGEFSKPLTPEPTDHILMPSLDTGLGEAFEFLIELRKQGIQISALIPDLLGIDYPELFPPGVKRLLLDHFSLLNEISTRIIVPSKHILERMRRFQSENALRFTDIEVGYPGTDHFERANPSISQISNKPFILFVSTIEPRKRQVELVKVLNNNPKLTENYNFVFAGKLGWLSKTNLAKFRKAVKKNKSLIFLDSITDSELTNALQSCSGLIMLSIDEGYGLPIIEAAYFNKPIFCSDIQVFRETTEEKATFCNTNLSSLETDLESWLSALKRDQVIQPPQKIALERTWQTLGAIWLNNSLKVFSLGSGTEQN
jgi:glycosyltransferase involved in cell wall biosynthesis